MTKRRTFLQFAGGSVVGLAGLPRISSAERSLEEIVDQAHQIREKTGSQERFLQYLRNQGLAVADQQTSHQVPSGAANDGYSTQELSSNNLDTHRTLIYRYNNCQLSSIYTEYSWTWNVGSGMGEAPMDYVSMAWPTDHYTYDSQTSGSRTSLVDRSNDGGSAVWKYDDTYLSAGDTHSSYAGCYIEENETDQTRHIGSKYRHSWKETELVGLSYTSGGDGAGFWEFEWSDVEYVWNGGYEQISDDEKDERFSDCQ